MKQTIIQDFYLRRLLLMDNTTNKLRNPYTATMLVGVVNETLVDVLGCSICDLAPEMSIGNDLGAESLDFVEIRYNLERRLGISLPQRSVIDQLAILCPSICSVASNGRLTEFGASALRGSIFDYSEGLVHEGVRPAEVMQGATISNWASLCLGILDCLPCACPDCSHTEAVISRTGKPACGACGTVLKPLSGDDALALTTEAWLRSTQASLAA
jgi:acyl carrier protein